MTDDSTPQTAIQVTTKIFPLGFLLLLFKTNVTVDGVTHVEPWGSRLYRVDPGHHSVEVGFRYIFGKNMGRNAVAFDVLPGQTAQVRYRAPFVVFAAGSISVS
jgi:hypothetical protein